MARASWASKAQLLARLRPYTSSDVPGMAPPDLLSELCGWLRAFTPGELRLVLAAYSGHPPDSPSLRLVQSPKQSNSEASVATRLHDVIVQLLVGGSRLGSTTQLLEVADTIAHFAPCDSRAAVEFWTVFAERAARLSASDSLDASQLSCILAVCAGWEKRCGSLQCRSTRKSGGAWGHMLRSVGGRLAEPRLLDTLSLRDVVDVARHAAQCAEPQLRLAASLGFRVGLENTSKSYDEQGHLTAEDLVDLIGAGGKLGGRLHMMTRALADRLEPQSIFLPSQTLVRLCSHLGSLEMFPQQLFATLEIELAHRVTDLETISLLRLLHASGRLRWRVPAILDPLLELLCREVASLDNSELGSIVYELYRLDLWDESLTETTCERLLSTGGSQLTWKSATNVLLALTYFAYPATRVYEILFKELLRSQDLPPEAIFQLKTIEMAMRVGHCAVSFKELGKLVSTWLFGIRRASTAPESRGASAFALDVSAIADNVSWTHQSEVEIGPYVLDFAAVSDGGMQNEELGLQGWDEQKPGRSLIHCCVAVEADGPSHFYRPHGKPWRWTSASKLRHRLLTTAGIRVAHVPYYDWLQLETQEQKEIYLGELLLRTQSETKSNRSSNNGKVAQSFVSTDVSSGL